jgi:hypothetical protein
MSKKKMFESRYSKDPGGSIPPGFWAGLVMVSLLLWWMHGCQGGVSP